jgi:hypothetical protein
MPGTPARSEGVMLAGSGVLAIVTAGVCLAVHRTATPASAGLRLSQAPNSLPRGIPQA